MRNMPNLSPVVVRSVIDRQALLWVCQRYDLREGQDIHQFDLPATTASLRYRKELTAGDREIAKLYWEAAWFEGAQSPLLTAFRIATTEHPGSRTIIVLAAPADVDARVPVEEFLPIRVLPGVIDDVSPLDAQYGTVKSRVRERTAWDFASKLKDFRGRVLVVLGAKQLSDLERLFQVLEDLPSIDLTVLLSWPNAHVPEQPRTPNVTFEWWQGSDHELVSALASAGAPLATDLPDWGVRVASRAVSLGPKDVRHVLTRFVLLTERDILAPRELTMDDLHAFLRGDINSWKAYGAGLPVSRSYRAEGGKVFDAEIQELLGRLSRGEDESFSLTVQLPAEGGAGVTTLIRSAAYRAAAAGFPTLVLRPEQVDVDLDHILAFSDAVADKLASAGADQQPPLLIVSDVEHSRISTLKQIPQLLASRNRRVLLLQAVNLEDTESEPKRTRRFVRLKPLKTESNEAEVRTCQETFSSLASRWNLPLQPRTTADWQSYERATRWRSTGTEDQESLFWVALRFFLIEGFTDDQRESLERAVGAWIDKRTDAVVDASMKRLLDFTAVLSSFRIAAPIWTVLRPITGGTFSSSVVEALRSTQDVV